MKKRLKHLICMLLAFSLIFCVTYAADNEEAETPAEVDKPVFVVEMNEPAEGAPLVISVYLKRMPSLIAGGSLGLSFAEDLGEFEFNCEFPYFEVSDTTEKSYHFFHFMEQDENIEETEELKGIDAQGENKLLLCTYTFKNVNSSANVTKASVLPLQFDKTIGITDNFAPEVIDDAWKYDEDGIGCYQGVYFKTVDEGDYIDGETFNIYFEFNLPDAQLVNVSGKVRSYDPKKETTVKLINLNDPTDVHSVTLSEESGKGRKIQEFYFEGVLPGTYSLEITKPTHTAYTKLIVEIGTEDTTLTGLDGKDGDVATLLCGDTDGDGFIKFPDRNLLLSSGFYGKKATDDASKLCDLDGDGYVKFNDLSIMMASENYNKGAVIIP